MKHIGLALVESYSDTTMYRWTKMRLIKKIKELEHEYARLSYVYLDLKNSMELKENENKTIT